MDSTVYRWARRSLAALSLALGLALGTGAARAEEVRTATLELFVGQTVQAAHRFWSGWMAERGQPYHPPRVVLVQSGPEGAALCGLPRFSHLYCLGEESIYLDYRSGAPESFETLWREHKPFVIVSIIGHEWGHHVQKVRGQFNGRGPGETGGSGRWIVEAETQADCLAGAFASAYTAIAGWVEPRDLAEAIENTRRLGSEEVAVSRRTHGTAEERVAAFLAGWDARHPAACGS